tara:strand:- start:548 stop:868 length:321 start_codon:yes stop_codon:yes gene_type:complete
MFFERPVFKMYVKTGCPFCEKAREIILKDLKSSLHLIDVTDQPDLRQSVIEETGCKTVPVIFLGKSFIGGCDDLIGLCQSGDVENLILTEENRILREEVALLRRSI